MSKDKFRTVCRKANGAPRCGGTSHMSISCCKREPTERALLHCDDAHAAVTRIVWACEHGPRTGVVCNVGWLRAWLIDRCSKKDARKSESKTPTPCPTDRQSENEKEGEDKRKRKRERNNIPRTMLLSNLPLFPTTEFIGHSLWACVVLSFLCGCCGLWEHLSFSK